MSTSAAHANAISASAATQPRRRDIKAGNDPTDLRRRRADTTISLRKAKKEQGLAAKRRNTAASASSAAVQVSGGAVLQSGAAEAGMALAGGAAGPARQYTPEDVSELAQNLRSMDVPTRAEAARGLRKVLSLESDPPVDAVIQAGAMPLLVLCLDQHDHTDLQVLINIVKKIRTHPPP